MMVMVSCFADFNPRSREGSDSVIGLYENIKMISIHAPVKGATDYYSRYRCHGTNFNPRSREGSDEIPEQ